MKRTMLYLFMLLALAGPVMAQTPTDFALEPASTSSASFTLENNFGLATVPDSILIMKVGYQDTLRTVISPSDTTQVLQRAYIDTTWVATLAKSYASIRAVLGTITGLADADSEYVFLAAAKIDSLLYYSNADSVTPTYPAPSDVELSGATDTTIDFAFTNNYRATTDSLLVLNPDSTWVATLDADYAQEEEVTGTITGLQPDSTYTFLFAAKEGSDVYYGETASLATEPSGVLTAPTDVTATTIGYTSVTVSLTNGYMAADSLGLDLAADSTRVADVASPVYGLNTVTVTGLSPGTEYLWIAFADSEGTKAYADTLGFTTLGTIYNLVESDWTATTKSTEALYAADSDPAALADSLLIAAAARDSTQFYKAVDKLAIAFEVTGEDSVDVVLFVRSGKANATTGVFIGGVAAGDTLTVDAAGGYIWELGDIGGEDFQVVAYGGDGNKVAGTLIKNMRLIRPE